MKSVKRILIQFTLLILIVSCKNSDRKIAENELKKYAGFVDSVYVLNIKIASQNWDAIQSLNDKNKVNALSALNEISNSEKSQKKLDQAILKFERFKAKVILEKERSKMDKATKINNNE